MTQKEVKIVVPDGYEVDRENSSFERIVFKKKAIALPKSWEEFCLSNPTKVGESFISADGGITNINGTVKRYAHSDKNLLPSHHAAQQHLALMQLHQLRDCYRQGWLPDWSTATEKWCVMLMNGHIVIRSSMALSYFLSFDSEDTAKKFAMNFPDLINQAGDLI